MAYKNMMWFLFPTFSIQRLLDIITNNTEKELMFNDGMMRLFFNKKKAAIEKATAEMKGSNAFYDNISI